MLRTLEDMQAPSSLLSQPIKQTRALLNYSSAPTATAAYAFLQMKEAVETNNFIVTPLPSTPLLLLILLLLLLATCCRVSA